MVTGAIHIGIILGITPGTVFAIFTRIQNFFHMKRTTLLITSVVLMVGCSKSIDEKNLVNRDGLKYEANKKTPFNGKTVSTYDNSQRELEGSYRDGKKDGQFTYWFKNGQKLKEGIYKDGKEDG